MVECRDLDGGGQLWFEAPTVCVLTPTAFATTDLGHLRDVNDLVRELNESGDMSPLGFVRKEIKLENLARLAILKGPSVLVFRGRQWYKDAIHLPLPFELAKEIFQAVKKRVGDSCEEVTTRAAVADVPLGPELMSAIGLALLAALCLLGGAYRQNARGRMPAVGWFFFFVGWLVGPYVAIALGVFALGGAAFALRNSVSNLPMKRELRLR